jgi:hypothetical protein
MNEFDAWYKILEEWREIKRTKRLIQELYEQVGGTLFFILDYAKKNGILLHNRDSLYRMADRIHYLMHEIEPPISDDRIQPAKNHSSDEEEYRTLTYRLVSRLLTVVGRTLKYDNKAVSVCTRLFNLNIKED